MARLTVRLPDSLHKILEVRAATEGVSKNQYIVYALTQMTAIEPVGEERAQYASLLERLEQLGSTKEGEAAAVRFLRAHQTATAFLPEEKPRRRARAGSGKTGAKKTKRPRAKRRT